jgi:hypothetical protein
MNVPRIYRKSNIIPMNHIDATVITPKINPMYWINSFRSCLFMRYPMRDSNPHKQLRTLMCYPLHQSGMTILIRIVPRIGLGRYCIPPECCPLYGQTGSVTTDGFEPSRTGLRTAGSIRLVWCYMVNPRLFLDELHPLQLSATIRTYVHVVAVMSGVTPSRREIIPDTRHRCVTQVAGYGLLRI